MKAAQKNWLLPNNNMFCFSIKTKMSFLLILVFLFNKLTNAQIANYVNNGSFEECGNCPQMFAAQIQPKYWSSIDTNKFFGQLLSSTITPYLVPNSSYTYQWPVHGNNHLISTLLFVSQFSTINRGYPRNRLKHNLISGHAYCVKFYCNISNQSTHGISSVGAYFSDSSIDTITQCEKAITYLTPQVLNPATNTITDTLNWTLITGTFIANGTEKYLVLGNFKSDVNSGTILINPTNLPSNSTDVLYDDVSVIDVDLPAYAGPDIFGIPNNTVYIGRPQDVGIDEACMWYKLPNTTIAIDTAAGITRTVSLSIDTYVVRQEICGNVKWDTVVIYPSGVGLSEQETMLNTINIYPNPASDKINILFSIPGSVDINHVIIYNAMGQLIREEEINFKNNSAFINTSTLPAGVYYLNIEGVNKRFVITH